MDPLTFMSHLAWPAVVLVALLLLLRPVSNLVTALAALPARLRKAGPIELNEPAEQAAALKAVEKGKAEALSLPPLIEDPTLGPWLKQVRLLIETYGVARTPDYEERLIHAWASTYRLAEAETTARLIFGTQFAALRQLAGSGPSKLGALKAAYDQHVVRAQLGQPPLAPLDLLTWIGFLSQRGLIVADDQGAYRITEAGHWSLQYAPTIGVSEARPL